MLALEIEIDGKPWVVAGVEDWSILSFHITASRHEERSAVRDGYIEANVGGLSLPDGKQVRHHFRWPRAPLEIGSCVTVRIAESTETDIPKKRYRSDRTIQESPFTDEETCEMRYRTYLELKEEFEQTEMG